MTSDAVLFAFVIATWVGIALVCWRARISVLPAIPVLPAVAIGLGALLNHGLDWSGTTIVVGVHGVAGIALALRYAKIKRDRRQTPGDDETPT